ncbi:hypothetical protein SEMRO_645_G180660.1 [Seminavis robusta]|uniref:Uncharacterized protein n=1 Tax=Seminavis robusta TaxID=568900 RepID=A0A9N8E4L9_9STRA|nr:hypothetical protein SEMRO_645_G180660.1 [Seminavis robusta]|eukprot:Sro645_g180660.1 n/a (175) ;mRNA; f:36021-36545
MRDTFRWKKWQMSPKDKSDPTEEDPIEEYGSDDEDKSEQQANKTPGRSKASKKRGTPQTSIGSSKRRVRTPSSVSTVGSGRGTMKDPVVPAGVFDSDNDDDDNLPPVARKKKTLDAKTQLLFCQQPSQADACPSLSSMSSSDSARARHNDIQALLLSGKFTRHSSDKDEEDKEN